MFVLDNVYLNCPGVGSYKQISGVAMGSSFAVVYVIVYMLHIKSSVVEEYTMHILVYKCFIDHITLVWQPSHNLHQYVPFS